MPAIIAMPTLYNSSHFPPDNFSSRHTTPRTALLCTAINPHATTQPRNHAFTSYGFTTTKGSYHPERYTHETTAAAAAFGKCRGGTHTLGVNLTRNRSNDEPFLRHEHRGKH